ncbi:MAG: hypothetical protein LBU77_02475 [Clostridiales bacterium]|nr:hypothetical protein [Clostridiales bacterium]
MEKIKATPMVFLLLLLGSLCFLAALTGYRFTSNYEIGLYIVFSVLIILQTRIMLKNRETQTLLTKRLMRIFPLAALVTVGCTGSSSSVEFFVIYSAITLICSLVLFFSYDNGGIVKLVLGALYLIMISFILLLFLIILFFRRLGLGLDTVVKSDLSPNAIYMAEIIDNNQGATGGNTYVEVTRKGQNIPLLFGELQKKPITVYRGQWGEGFSMNLRWESDHILYINDKKYDIQ